MPCRSALTCLLLVTLLVPARRADACGPDFPPELLFHRAATLAEMPDGLFAHEARYLLGPAPTGSFRPVDVGPEPEDARKGGPRETALYAAGAAAYEEGDFEVAQARFQDLLALPPEERRRLSVAAAFMLGRLAGPADEARQHYAHARELALQGFEDPLELAVASLGQEARFLLDAGDDIGAVKLYAQQASYGSHSGTISLLLVARGLTENPARLKRSLGDPTVQRLVTTYLWTRWREGLWVDDEEPPYWRATLDLLASVPGLSGSDRLAAVAWRAGRFDVAERFAGQERTPLAAWVKAKLALRRGDRNEAERMLAEASAGLPEAEDWMADGQSFADRPRGRVEGERAVLALSSGDFVKAAEHLAASCSWTDLAYVAERVLTVDELQRLIATQPDVEKDRCALELGQLWDTETSDEKLLSLHARLRRVLARRLLRLERFAEAKVLFRSTPFEESVHQYVDARERARSSGDDLDKAEALYRASRLARRLGMEMLGTEPAPDWGWADGNYDPHAYWEEWETPEPGNEDPLQAAMARAVPQGEAERRRCQENAPPHPTRFHYRATAADLAEEAAALVPPRSQAYAMLLCHAARYVSSTDPKRYENLWLTYVKHGTLNIDEAWLFGQECPEPDFARVRQQRREAALPWKGMRRRTLAVVSTGLLAPMAAGLVLLLRRKRRDGAR